MIKHKRNDTNFCLQPNNLSTETLSWGSQTTAGVTYGWHDDVIKWKFFRVSGPLWGKPPVTSGFLHKGQWREAYNVFFDLCPNKRFGKQSRHWWFETPSRPLWRHRNERPIVYRRSIRMKTYIDTHMHIHFVGLILMLWHKKTQINPTKEPIDYRAPGGDRTHANINKANLRDLIAATGILISSWIQIVNFAACVTVKFDGWPRKTIGHFFYLRQALCSIS